MQNQNQMKQSTIALASLFDCETTEEHTSFPKVRIVAEITIDRGEIHHVNTDEIKEAIGNAVKNAVWYCETKPSAEAGHESNSLAQAK